MAGISVKFNFPLLHDKEGFIHKGELIENLLLGFGFLCSCGWSSGYYTKQIDYSKVYDEFIDHVETINYGIDNDN